jgi:mannitol/fructose-specific phosphotransferase system IIA component (Ntr-type)
LRRLLTPKISDVPFLLPDGLQSNWVGEELAHALKLRKKRGGENYPVIPLSLDGTRLGVLNKLLGKEPVYIPVSSEPVGIKATELLRRLKAREEESTTALTPYLAIPHVVLPDSSPFAMLLIRCRAGVNYGPDAEAVKAVVVLAGARKERNFHLKALAAIAQTVHSEDFEARWQAAKGDQALRDIFLLASRHRDATRTP